MKRNVAQKKKKIPKERPKSSHMKKKIDIGLKCVRDEIGKEKQLKKYILTSLGETSQLLDTKNDIRTIGLKQKNDGMLPKKNSLQ